MFSYVAFIKLMIFCGIPKASQFPKALPSNPVKGLSIVHKSNIQCQINSIYYYANVTIWPMQDLFGWKLARSLLSSFSMVSLQEDPSSYLPRN